MHLYDWAKTSFTKEMIMSDNLESKLYQHAITEFEVSLITAHNYAQIVASKLKGTVE